MLMSTFLKTRRSIREYKKKQIMKSHLNELESYIEGLNKKAQGYGASFHVYSNGYEIASQLEGKGGYAGVMIKAPAYITLEIKEEKDIDYIYGAYYLEDVITKLEDIGLGSCWVSLHGASVDIKKKAFIGSSGNIPFVLATGYPITQLNRGLEEQFRSKLGTTDFVFDGSFNKHASHEYLEHRGLDDIFYYLRYAPSAYNRQPWRFLLKENTVYLYIEDYEGNINLVDAGIIMYYFVKMAESMSIRSEWEIDPNGQDIDNKKYIAQIKI